MSASRLTLILGTSLALNGLLSAALWLKTADTRAYWLARVKATPTPAASPLGHVGLAPPPPGQPDYAEHVLADVVPARAYAGQAGAAFAPWRARAREALAEALGRPQGPPVREARQVARTEFPTVVREKHYLRMHDGLWVPAWLLRPRAATGPRPAVLALPGHDAPMPAWGRGAADLADAAKPHNYMGGFGMKLAEAGYVVLAMDVAGIGELADLGYTALAMRGLLAGEPLTGRMVSQARQGLGWLAAQPGVDAGRVGTAGLSLGGQLALYTAVLDPRVAFAADAGYFTSYRDIPGTAMAAAFLPGILRDLDLPDVAGALAPRPLLVQADPRDPIVPARDLAAYRARTAAAYAGAGAPRAFTFQAHELGHHLDLAGLAAWLGRVAPVAGR